MSTPFSSVPAAAAGYTAERQQQGPPQGFDLGSSAPQFDIFDWHPAHASCQRYFLQYAQYDHSVQAVCALINILLPHQRSNPIIPATFTPTPPDLGQHASARFPPFQLPSAAQVPQPPSPNWVSLVPFIRRLVVTGFDRDAVLHGFFGDDWRKGVGPVQECERRNYMFAAKSGGWAQVKQQYDMGPQETVPFLQPPQNIQLSEIENAEKLWSQWLAMEDWVIGPRAPQSMEDYSRGEARSSQNSKGT